MRITIKLDCQYSWVTYHPKLGWLGRLMGRKEPEPYTEKFKTDYSEYRGGGHVYHNIETGYQLPYRDPVGRALDTEYEMCRMRVGRYKGMKDYDYSKIPDGEYNI
jgi:hypothetical protein